MDLYQCQYCNGNLNFLGILGNREHFNCRDCGTETSQYTEKYVSRFNVLQTARKEYIKIAVLIVIES
jgi:tRNA(Ile2) C34 agmatinyltransferase TiaS